MKKIIIGLSGLIVLTFFVVLLVSAQSSDKETGKARTEIVKECPHSSGQMACPGHTAEKSAPCNPADCKDAGCDHENCTGTCKETATAAKCDPAVCSHHAASGK
ncbi:MAG: hypothetical protein R6W81_11235 [Bacteroidales bacterium]